MYLQDVALKWLEVSSSKYCCRMWSSSALVVGDCGRWMDLQLLKSCRSPVWVMFRISRARRSPWDSLGCTPLMAVGGNRPCRMVSALSFTISSNGAGLLAAAVSAMAGVHGDVIVREVKGRQDWAVWCCSKGKVQKKNWKSTQQISSLRGSLTHFVEVEGEPFKAGWFLVILSNKGLTVEVEKERMVMSTQVRACPCIVLRHEKSWITSENIASSEVFGHPAPKEMSCVIVCCNNTRSSFLCWHSAVSKVGLYAKWWGLCDEV